MISPRLALCVILLLWSPTIQAQSLIFAHDDAHGATVKRWSNAINASNFESASWVMPMEGKAARDRKHKNGRRDTILLVPHSSSGDDITLVVWLHGLGGFNERTFRERLMPQVESLLMDGQSIALAIPEMPWSTNTSTPRGRQGQVFRSAGSFESYVAHMQVRLGHWLYQRDGEPPGMIRLSVVGHSAGGSALASAGREGGLCRVQPDVVVWSDASYGRWLDRAWRGCLESSRDNTRTYVIVRKWGSPHRNLKRMLRGLSEDDRPEIDVRSRSYTHKRIGDGALLMSPIFGPGC